MSTLRTAPFLVLSAILVTVGAWEMDKMAYVYMFSRHGSRTPRFEVGPELLAQAMKDFTVEPE